jgi:flagellar biosynthesis/type III secretory pathway protein FliH
MEKIKEQAYNEGFSEGVEQGFDIGYLIGADNKNKNGFSDFINNRFSKKE